MLAVRSCAQLPLTGAARGSSGARGSGLSGLALHAARQGPISSLAAPQTPQKNISARDAHTFAITTVRQLTDLAVQQLCRSDWVHIEAWLPLQAPPSNICTNDDRSSGVDVMRQATDLGVQQLVW